MNNKLKLLKTCLEIAYTIIFVGILLLFMVIPVAMFHVALNYVVSGFSIGVISFTKSLVVFCMLSLVLVVYIPVGCIILWILDKVVWRLNR